MKIFLGLLLAGSLFAQTPLPSPSQGGSGGGGGSPASPLNSVQLNVSGSFGSDPGFIDYNAGIPDPPDAPSCSLTGTPGTTSYTFAVVEYLGGQPTFPSPTTTIANGPAVLDMTNFISCTLPVVADPNIQFALLNETTLLTNYPLSGIGGIALDDTGPMGELAIAVSGPPNSNLTQGLLIPGSNGGILSGSAGIALNTNPIVQNNPTNATFTIATTDQNGNQIGGLSNDSQDNFYFYQSSLGARGLWTEVITVGGSGGQSSPLALSYNSSEIIKGDTSLADVEVDLPAISTFPVLPVGINGQGVQFLMHKPMAANVATLATTDGTSIGGTGPVGPAIRNSSTSISITGQNCSILVYWDLNTDGNAGQWAITQIYCPTIESSTALDFPSIADGSCSALTFTLTGAGTGANLAPGFPSALNAGLTGSMFVSAANTVTVTLCNLSGSPIDPASLTYSAAVVQ